MAEIAVFEGITRQRVWQLAFKIEGFNRRIKKTPAYQKCLNCPNMIIKIARRKFCSRKCVQEYYKTPDDIKKERAELYKIKKRLYAKQRYHNVIKLRKRETIK